MQSVQKILSQHMDDLSPKLQAAATFVMQQPQEVATRTMRQVAKISNLPPPTFSRLARAVGCKDFEELRECCRIDLKRNTLSYAEKAKVLQQSHDGSADVGSGTFIVRQAQAAISNIENLVNSIDNQVLSQVADKLVSAKNVYLIGAMSSRAFVEYMDYMTDMAFSNWRVVNRQGASLAADLATIDKQDIVLAVSKHPFARSTIEATKIAHDKGAYVVAITDRVDAPILQYTDQGFYVSTESPQFFTSHVATLVLLESLVGMVIRRSGDEAQQYISSVAQTNQLLGEYWDRN